MSGWRIACGLEELEGWFPHACGGASWEGCERVQPTGVEGESAGVIQNGRAPKSGAGIDGNRECG